MRIGWLADKAEYVGGAELTTREFRGAAPDDVEIVDCPAGAVVKACDRYVIHNALTYTLKDLDRTGGNPTVKYHHDVGTHLSGHIKAWLDANARHVCCSPVQAEYMGLDAACVPPPVDLARFERAADAMNGGRSGSVSVGQWRNYGKAPHRAREHDPTVDFFGAGVFAPAGSREILYDAMPALLAQYQTFIHLPTVVEPFGRLIAEAWAAGCEIVTNDLVGAKYYITEAPDSLYTAGDDFWALVLAEPSP